MKILTLLLLASCFGCGQTKETRNTEPKEGDPHLRSIDSQVLSDDVYLPGETTSLGSKPLYGALWCDPVIDSFWIWNGGEWVQLLTQEKGCRAVRREMRTPYRTGRKVDQHEEQTISEKLARKQVKATLLTGTGDPGIHCLVFYGNGDPVYGTDAIADKRSNHGEFIVRCKGWK